MLGATCLGFLLVVVLLSLAIGAPFVLPDERVSPALGVNYGVPFAVAVAGVPAGLVVVCIAGGIVRDRLRRAAIDIYLLLLFAVVMYGHFHLKMWMPVINPRLFDAAYHATDDHLRFALTIIVGVRDAIVAALPMADGLYQAGYLGMYVLSLWGHAFGHRRWHYHNFTAVLLLEMVGPLTYLIAPAVGPFIYESGRNLDVIPAQQVMYANLQAVQREGVGWLAQHGGGNFTGLPAAMPSLHIAAAWILTYYAVKARLLIWPLSALLLIWIAIDGVALRWHYVIDMPAGIALAAVVIAATNRLCREVGGCVTAPRWPA